MVTLTRPDGNHPDDFKLSRRAAAGVFFAGYAAAALSAQAEPIHTDEAGLIIETVSLPAADRSIPGYLARPAGPGRHPSVIVVNEVFGIHDYIKDICRRLAKLGYVAVAPAFFVRAGDPAPLTDFPAIMKIVAAASDAQVMGDVAATLKFLSTQAYVDTSRIAITGFCWGGRIVWLACEQFREIKAGVSWYGPLAPPADAAPDPAKLWPIQHVASLRAPVLGLYGGQDKLSADVPAMRVALADAGRTSSQIIVYPDAGHGFHADYRPSYNAVDAKDGWSRLTAFFVKNGVAP